MKKLLLLIGIVTTCFSCIINNPKPEDCIIQTVTISKITEGTSFDINRGLERGLNLDSLNAKVLNKTVTLHLAKVFGGITSEHISQLAVGNEIIFTEFN